MNGPQHYAKAEALMESANYSRREEGENETANYELRLAQVHATLAQAAAIAELDGYDNVTARTAKRSSAWAGVLDS